MPHAGRQTIERVIEEKPDVFLKMIAQIIPKEFHVRDNTLDHMSDDELADFLSSSFASCTPISWSTARPRSSDVRENKPDVYLKLIAQVIPKEFHVRDNTLDHMTDEELTEFLATIRAAKERSRRELARLTAERAAPDDEDPGRVH